MYYIGIDIGGTNLKAGLVDESHQIVATKKMPLQFQSMEQMGDTLVRMAMELVEEYGISRSQVASVGMGFPGLVDNKKGVVKNGEYPHPLYASSGDVPQALESAGLSGQ